MSKSPRSPPELQSNKSTLHKKYELTNCEKQLLLQQNRQITNGESKSFPKLKFTKRTTLDNQECFKKMLADLPNRLDNDYKKIHENHSDEVSQLDSIAQNSIENNGKLKNTFIILETTLENGSAKLEEKKETFTQTKKQNDQIRYLLSKKDIMENANLHPERYVLDSSLASSNENMTKNEHKRKDTRERPRESYERTKTSHQSVTFDRGLSTPELILKSQQLMRIHEAEEERELKRKKQTKQKGGMKSQNNDDMRNKQNPSTMKDDLHLKYMKLAFYEMEES